MKTQTTQKNYDVRTSDFHGSQLISSHKSLRAAMIAQYAKREIECRCGGPQIIALGDDQDSVDQIIEDADYAQSQQPAGVRGGSRIEAIDWAIAQKKS